MTKRIIESGATGWGEQIDAVRDRRVAGPITDAEDDALSAVYAGAREYARAQGVGDYVAHDIAKTVLRTLDPRVTELDTGAYACRYAEGD